MMPLLEAPLSPTQERLSRLNAEQRRAVEAPIDGLVQIMAGAGTGKTEVMAARIARIFSDLAQSGEPEPLKRVLAMSFTHKAARELFERVQRYLPTLSGVETDDEANPQTGWITTIHGACMRLLREQPDALARQIGLNGHFKVIGELEQAQLFDRLLRDMANDGYTDISEVLKRSGLSECVSPEGLSLKSLKALPVEDLEAVLLLLPSVIARIKSAGLSPKAFYDAAQTQGALLSEALAMLPVTNPHDGEPLGSLENLAAAWASHIRPWADTRWVAECREPHLEKEFYKTRIKPLLESKLYVAFDRKHKAYLPVSPDDSGQLQADKALQALLTAENQMLPVVAAFYAIYQARLRAQNLADYDDLILHTIDLLTQDASIRQSYQRQFRAILVDEFQDTNNAQLQLLRLLMRPDYPNLTIVGDAKQSIYGFRFAQPENLALIAEGIDPEYRHTIALSTNYRSHAEILATANRLAAAIAPQDEVLQVADNPVDLTSSVGVQFEVISGANGDQPEDADQDVNQDAENPKIEALKAREADRLVELVQQWVASGEFQPSEIAVLTRSRSKAAAIARALEAALIPVSLQAELGFFQRPMVKLWAAVLRLMVNPREDHALVALLQTRLNPRQLWKIARKIPRSSSWHAALASGEAMPDDFSPALRQALVCVCDMVTRVPFLPISEQGVSPAAVVNTVKSFMRNLLEPNAAHSASPTGALGVGGTSEQMLWRTWQMLIKTLSGTPTVQAAKKPAEVWAALVGFLDRLEADPNARLPQPGDEAYPELQDEEQTLEKPINLGGVQVMTAYSAKGLEFPAVIVAWVESKQGGGRNDRTLLQYDPCLGDNAARSASPSGALNSDHNAARSASPSGALSSTGNNPGYGLMLGELPDGTVSVKSGLYRTAWKKPRAQAERDRLFYVALTRAKSRLHVLGADHDAAFGALFESGFKP